MRNKLLFLRVLFSLFLLIGCSSLIKQSSLAEVKSCESEKWVTFLKANSIYNKVYRIWYHNNPLNCVDTCEVKCVDSTNPNCETQCINDCPLERFNNFSNAQDRMILEANKQCPPLLDSCRETRQRLVICRDMRTSRFEEPVYDPTNKSQQIDHRWVINVDKEFMACREATSISNCK